MRRAMHERPPATPSCPVSAPRGLHPRRGQEGSGSAFPLPEPHGVSSGVMDEFLQHPAMSTSPLGEHTAPSKTPCRAGLRDANNLVDQQNELFQQYHRLAILRNLSCFNYRFCSHVLTLLTLAQSLWLLVLLLI
ncbi:hypothetical protein GQ55_4G060000 [Panicum hallii var. hallii]|uniref:Uncharacterized protein n=1 Tax=Panicum hallii var. hallii TaxID=1504633 RepID=A0A2T7DVQ4_9POAL|nr:hypothetical protein GQ55_4G060000 [Panicum hallii var. hallii]